MVKVFVLFSKITQVSAKFTVQHSVHVSVFQTNGESCTLSSKRTSHNSSAASAAVSQTNDDGTDTIHQLRSGIDLASHINLLRLKRSWPLGVADLLCKIPVANDRSGFPCNCMYICFEWRVQIIFHMFGTSNGLHFLSKLRHGDLDGFSILQEPQTLRSRSWYHQFELAESQQTTLPPDHRHLQT